MFLGYDYEEVKFGFLDDNGEYEDIEPDFMNDWFSQLVLSARKQTILWVFALDLLYEQIIYLLYFMGYHDVTESAPPVKAWKVHDFDYILSDDGKCFRIRIKTFDKSTLYIYNASNIIGKDVSNICSDFTKDKQKSIYNLTVGGNLAIQQLTRGQKKRTPFTISMIAQKSWHELDGIDYACSELIDCHSIQSPVQGVTLDEYLRPSYRSGWNYLYKKNCSGFINQGVVLDANSLYPFIQATKPMPWGSPVYGEGAIPKEIMEDEKRYYYIRFRCCFDIKPGFLPWLTIRNDMTYMYGESLETSDFVTKEGKRSHTYFDTDGKERVFRPELTLSKTDFELFMKTYNVYDIEYIDHVVFRTIRSAFKYFVKSHYDGKSSARSKGDKAWERIEKLQLNALSGSLGKESSHVGIFFTEDKDGCLVPHTKITKSQSKSHIHMASAILSYAREYIYNFAQANRDRFLYTDTDSLHLKGSDISGFPISAKIGDFKVEKEFKHAYYYKRKSYVLVGHDDTVMVTMAGLSKEYREYLETLLTGIIKNRHKVEALSMIAAFEQSGISSEIRGEVLGVEDNGHGGLEVMRSVKSEAIEHFERELLKAKTTKDKLLALQYMPIPNGFRQPNGWENNLIGSWFTFM